MFTVRDLISVEDLGLSVVAATAEGLDEPVTGAFITDLPKPGAFLYEGAIVLTSGLWTRNHGDVVSFMNALAAHRVGGVVLGLLEIEVVPDVVIAMARASHIPLLTTRNDIAFSTISDTITRKLAPVNEGVFQRILDFAADLSELGPAAPHNAPLVLFRHRFDVECWVVDASANVWAAAGTPLADDEAAAVWNHALRTRTLTGRASSSGSTGRYYWALDETTGVRGGLIVCDADDHAYGDINVAMSSLRGAVRVKMALTEIERSSRLSRLGHLVSALEAAPTDPALVALSLSLEGAEPSAATLVVSADIADGNFPPETLLAVMEDTFRDKRGAGIVVLGTTLGTEAIMLINGVSDDGSRAVTALTTGLERSGALFDGRAVRVGISDPSAAPMLGDALGLARQRRGAMSGPGLQVGVDSKADRYQGLIRLVAERARTTFAQSILGPLLEHDEQHRSNLLGTLRVHLAHAGVWQAAASELHIHPNTLRYRIGRLEELTGRDLSVAQHRTDLEVALVCLDLAG